MKLQIRGIRGAAALSVALGAAPLSAQPAPPTQAPPAEPADDDEEPKSTVRVQGTKRAGSASETTVERDVIRAAPHKTASDTLAVVPGVAVTQHSGQGKAHQIFFRGFDAAHGQDVEIWVAGAPVNEVSNVHGQGYADLHFVMPEVIERIESLPGTYDVRQGDFAVAGTMRFKLGYDEPGFTASGTAGMFGERRLFFAYAPPSGDGETFAAVEAQATSGFGESRAARRVSGIGQIAFDVGDVARIRLMSSLYAARFDSAGVLLLEDVRRGAVDPFSTYDPKQGGDALRAQIVAEIQQAGPEDTKDRWAFAPFFIARSMKLRHDFTGYLVDPDNGDNTQQTNDAKTFGTTGSYTRRFDWLSPRDEVSIGMFARADWIDQDQVRLSRVSDRTTARLVDAEIQATDVAGWVETEVTAWQRLRMRAGLRADGLFYSALDALQEDAGVERSSMGFHLGPKASVDVMAVPGLNFLASFGTGFRSPQARSLADGEKTPFAEVISFEGGARGTVGPELDAKAAVFHTRLSKDLVFDEVLVRNEVTPPTARTGFTVEVTSRPTPWLTSSTSVTFTRAVFTDGDAEFEEGDLLPYTPQVVARSDLGVSPRLATVLDRALVLKAGTGLSYLGARPLPFSEIGSDTFLVDATVGLRWREAELRADFYNLFDARWFDGEFSYASNFQRGAAAGLVPRTHVTVGQPFTFLATASVYL